VKNSISFKFNILAIVCVTVLLVGFGAYNYISTEKSLRKQLDAQVGLMLGRLQLSLPTTLWNFEGEQTGKVLESEVQAEFVKGLYLYNGTKLIASRTKSLSGAIVKDENLGTEENLSESELTYDDSGTVNAVGRAIIEKDDTYIVELLQETLIRLVVQTLVLDIVLSILLSMLIQL